jgi:hypothetical protein
MSASVSAWIEHIEAALKPARFRCRQWRRFWLGLRRCGRRALTVKERSPTEVTSGGVDLQALFFGIRRLVPAVNVVVAHAFNHGNSSFAFNPVKAEHYFVDRCSGDFCSGSAGGERRSLLSTPTQPSRL